MDPAALLQQLRALAQNVPNLVPVRDGREIRIEPSTHQWIAKLHALLKANNDIASTTALEFNTPGLRHVAPGRAVDEIMGVLYRALAAAELAAPAGAQPAFLPAGNPFDALAAVAKLFQTARQSLLIVDPYLDQKILMDFAPMVREGVFIKLLSDEQTVKPNLRGAADAWVRQYGQNRPLEARLAQPRTLHDRVVILDESSAWVLTQSFKDLAERAPASLLESDAELSKMKRDAYAQVWEGAKKLL